MSALNKERRRRKRVDVALPLKIEYNKEWLPATIKNISILGAYVQAGKELPIGAELKVDLEIPSAAGVPTTMAHVSCTAVVFRCQFTGSGGEQGCFGTGIFFRSFHKGGEEQLSRYIDRILLEEKIKGLKFMEKRKSQKERKESRR